MSEFPGIARPLARALSARGYETLTPVQQSVCSEHLDGADLLVSAQTGSGKTVAFGIAIAPTLLAGAERFEAADKPLALVIAPTRELALQVRRELEWLYADAGAVITSCVGGMDIRTERRALERGVHIVVGTPGRLRDHISRRAMDCRQLQAIVLDEADEMLDLGFKEDLEFILEAAPEDRRTLMFSATVPSAIAGLAKSYQRDAVRITTEAERDQHADIEYRALVVAPRERENAIVNVLRYYDPENALVFCNTRASVNHMVARFTNRGFSVVALSGELSQNERSHALQALRDGRAKVCIATDVAARGIDLPKLELVIHADLPSNPETLLHRSGRTGRAGRKGISALMVDVKGRNRAERLLRFAKLDATWANPPSADDVYARDEERMLASPALTEPPQPDESATVARLLEEFAPEQIAAAYLRQVRADHSAPEDIEMVSVHQPNKPKHERGERNQKPFEKKPRREFEKSVWVSLSVGRKQNAEPRWLIPLICNKGGLTKSDIGSIRVQPGETYVELDADRADDFMDSLGANATLEKNVRVRPVDGLPDMAPQKPFAKKPFKKDRNNDGDAPSKKKSDFKKRGAAKGAKPFKKKSKSVGPAGGATGEDKPKPFKKPKWKTKGAVKPKVKPKTK